MTGCFQKMAAVVHHGGASTTAASLRAGVPSIIVPFFADQPAWGQRLADLGVSPTSAVQRIVTRAIVNSYPSAVSDETSKANDRTRKKD